MTEREARILLAWTDYNVAVAGPRPSTAGNVALVIVCVAALVAACVVMVIA